MNFEFSRSQIWVLSDQFLTHTKQKNDCYKRCSTKSSNNKFSYNTIHSYQGVFLGNNNNNKNSDNDNNIFKSLLLINWYFTMNNELKDLGMN